MVYAAIVLFGFCIDCYNAQEDAEQSKQIAWRDEEVEYGAFDWWLYSGAHLGPHHPDLCDVRA